MSKIHDPSLRAGGGGSTRRAAPWTMGRAALGALVLGAAPVAASAQAPAPEIETVLRRLSKPSDFEAGQRSAQLQLGAGTPTSTNGFDDGVRNGPAVRVQFLYRPWSLLAAGLETGVTSFGKGPTDAGIANKVEEMSLLFVSRLNLRTEGSWSPYVQAAAGFHQMAIAGAGSTGTFNARRGGTARVAAGGVEGYVLPGLSLSYEARFTSYNLDTPLGDTGSLESLSHLIGLRYTWAP